MIKSLHLRAGAAAALAVGLLLVGCSSEPDFPDAPAGPQNTSSTTANSNGDFPDVNTVPTQRPSTTIQDLNQAPEGLSGAPSGTQYGEELVGGPTSSATRPAPPPEEELPPIPEPGITETTGSQTESSDSSTYAAPEPVAAATPEPAPAPEPEPQPVAQAVRAPAPGSAAPSGGSVQSAPLQPMPGAASTQPATPVGTPQPGARPFQPDAQLALASGGVATQSAALPQAQPAYGPNYAALAPENYGVTFSQPALPPYQPYSSAQAAYRSPYASPPTNYGGAAVVGANQIAPAPVYAAPAYPTYGQPAYGQTVYGGGQSVGVIYFRDGSAKLSSDDRKVLKQIADMHKTYGGLIRVVGHASMRTGSTDLASHQQANQRISEARANAVARHLTRLGVPSAAIQVTAMADSQPIYSEVMPNGEAANRRAEVYLTAY